MLCTDIEKNSKKEEGRGKREGDREEKQWVSRWGTRRKTCKNRSRFSFNLSILLYLPLALPNFSLPHTQKTLAI